MTHRDLFRIAARLLAVYIAILAVPHLGSLLGAATTILTAMFGDRDDYTPRASNFYPDLYRSAFTVLLYLLLAFCLWNRGDWLARRVLGQLADTPIPSTPPAPLGLIALRIFGLGLTILGTIGVVTAIVTGAWLLYNADNFKPGISESLFSIQIVREIAQPIAMLIAGILVLKLGPRWINPPSLPNP